MARNNRNIQLLFFFLPLLSGMASSLPVIDLKIPPKVFWGEDVEIRATIVDKDVDRVGLRYKFSINDEFSFIDFQKSSRGDFIAVVAREELRGDTLFYYVVWQKKDGSVHMGFGSLENPKKIKIFKEKNFVIHQNSSFQKKKAPIATIKDRFGDDEIEEQIFVYSAYASDNERSLLSKCKDFAKAAHQPELQSGNLNDSLNQFVEMRSSVVDQVPNSSYRGRIASKTLQFQIDGLRVEDEYDGADLIEELVPVSEIRLNDDPGNLMGISNGLFGSIEFKPARKKGIALQVGYWGQDSFRAALSGGGSLGEFDNFLSSSVTYLNKGWRVAAIGSSDLISDERDEGSLFSGVFHFSYTDAEGKKAKIHWNGGLFLRIPLAQEITSHITVSGGQTINEYETFRLSGSVETKARLSPAHEVSLGSQAMFASVTKEAQVVTPSYFGNCHGDCRLQATMFLKDQLQLGKIAALKSGVEISGASNQKNELDSLISPSAMLHLRPNNSLEFGVGFSKSMRSPTIQEHLTYSSFKRDSVLAAEKLRLFSLFFASEIPSKYTFVQLMASARTGWIDDGIKEIKLNQSSTFDNVATERFTSFGCDIGVRFADDHFLKLNFEMHPFQSGALQVKSIISMVINLEKFGHATLLLQAGSKESSEEINLKSLNLYYNSGRVFGHFSLGLRALNILTGDSLKDEERPRFYAELNFDL